MYYVLLDSTGNMLASYREEGEARAALDQIVEEDPGAADEVALMTYDDEGEIAAPAEFLVPTVAVVADHDEHSSWYGTERLQSWEQGSRTGHLVS